MMKLELEYRNNAASSLDLASRQADKAYKGRLLAMAEAWLDLADRLARRANKQHGTIDHPLVEQVLGPDQPSAE